MRQLIQIGYIASKCRSDLIITHAFGRIRFTPYYDWPSAY